MQTKEEELKEEQKEPEKPKKKGFGGLLSSVVKAVAKELDDPKFKPRKISYIHVSQQ